MLFKNSISTVTFIMCQIRLTEAKNGELGENVCGLYYSSIPLDRLQKITKAYSNQELMIWIPVGEAVVRRFCLFFYFLATNVGWFLHTKYYCLLLFIHIIVLSHLKLHIPWS